MKNQTTWKFGNIDLTPSVRRVRSGKFSSLIVVEGTGDAEHVFPPNEITLAETMKRATVLAKQLESQARKQQKAAAKRKQKGNQDKQEPKTATESSGTSNPEQTPAIADNRICIPPTQANGDPTLWVVAQGVLDSINAREWIFYVARFDEISGAYNAARQSIADGRMETNLGWVVESLDSHVAQLRAIYTYILPHAVTALKAAHPQLPREALAYCAAMALDEMFANINQVVSMYAMAFRQEMDGLYPVLDGLRVFLQSTYSLFETGDPTGCEECIPALKSLVYKAGARFLLLCGTDGPATIPGGQELLKGPIGVHLGLVNLNEIEILPYEKPIFGHENYHNFYFSVVGLAPETVQNVVTAFKGWANAGRFNFSTDHVMVGQQAVPILPLLISIIVQQMPEIAADLPGGVCFTGGAYWKAVFQLFVALNSDSNGVLNTKQGLRTDSVFEIIQQEDGSAQIAFETHTPDYARALMLGVAYDAIGFHEDAAKCRELANQANGYECPEFIEWADASGQVDWTVKVKTSDLIQMFEPLVQAILFGKMKSLGGLSNTQIVNWNEHREEKVQILVKHFIQLFHTGTAELPQDMGDIYPHYVGAALTHVYWELAGKGWKPKDIFTRLNEPGLKLMLDLAAKAQAKAEAKAAKCETDQGEQSH
jgi:hypothetical protein